MCLKKCDAVYFRFVVCDLMLAKSCTQSPTAYEMIQDTNLAKTGPFFPYQSQVEVLEGSRIQRMYLVKTK